MKIRSITYFCDPGWPLDESRLRAAGDFLSRAKAAYEAAGYEVQTTRLATIPFPRLLNGKVQETARLAQEIGRVAEQMGVGYVSLGPALPDAPDSYAVIPEAIVGSQNVFFGGVMAGPAAIHAAALRACAEVIVKCAPLDPNGFANLRFAALANVPAGAPFFPAAYHDGDIPAFAIATEAADLAVQAFSGSKTLDHGRQTLISEIEKHGKALASVAQTLARISNSRGGDHSIFDIRFGGIDFSLAPFPDDAHSLGMAVEKMGVPMIGLHGSLTAAAFLTEAVDRADFPHTGFSGFMQPVLEDSILAARAAEGTLTIKDLLLYSAVCGTGLDTVPLAGETTAAQIAALLLDLSAMALRLDKPLTARLMPVPGKQAGEPTTFDFGFFANSRVMKLEAAPLSFPLDGEGILHIRKR
ncbi:MAG TPA: DUF711 family protein [Anaerolineales bacterium]|jgi:hypothetical protein